ncbi:MULTISPECIES: zinc ribbon domain-containing protein [unclassified Limnobacter]|uniref:zinc ribbon domain-containing protein n=1 Tax=unclassified Limnobacter TaxID=2630203 RepID=UPI0025BB0135|nr:MULTISPECIES: zinc ribbon domain-containing protein [unclassified Limnobacter]|tara:strand:+ start:1958 stop:3862 length:1905 start_codon:yes stop_codon:yes gene_type:complete
MSYEFSSVSSRFEYPNPYAVENIFRGASAAFIVVCALVLFFVSRDSLTNVSQASLLSLAPIVVGLLMLLAGLAQGAITLSHLRFFFGRGEPNSLANETGEHAVNNTNVFKYKPDELVEIVRQNALKIDEPTGSLNGLLYSLLPNLIFAPTRIRNLAEMYFKNLAIVVALSLSYLFSIATVDAGIQTTIVGGVFLLVTLFFVQPINDANLNTGSNFGTGSIAALVLIGIFTPVILNIALSGITVDMSGFQWMATNTVTLILLLTTFVSSGIFFMSLMNNLMPPPNGQTSSETMTLSMNAHPKQLSDELQRELQRNWTEQIPNRVYVANEPRVGNSTMGSFNGDFVQETQPMPEARMDKLTIKEALANKNYTWLVFLNMFGTAMYVIGAIVFVIFGVSAMNNPTDLSNLNLVGVGMVLWVAATHAFNAASRIWGKFNFISTLYWVEMDGNYQTTSIDFGNQFTDRVKSSKTVTNIETATIRVWVAEIFSVVFKKSDVRHIVGMRGNAQKAKFLAQHLCEFGADQAVIVAPGSKSDLKRVATLGALNTLGGAGGGADLKVAASLTNGMEGAAIAAGAAASSAASVSTEQAMAQAEKMIDNTRADSTKEIPLSGKVCSNCDAVAEPGDAFCSECGNKF